MSSLFSTDTLTTKELTTCAAGEVAWPSTYRQQALVSIIVLISDISETALVVELGEGDDLRLLRSRKPTASSEPVITIANSPLTVELPDAPSATGNPEKIGALTVTSEGAFFRVTGKDSQGFAAGRYVSTRDWTVQDFLPNGANTTFSSWRLTTTHANSNERRVIYTRGEW
jgi:hypothetical protein